jgi:hypothetical protein
VGCGDRQVRLVWWSGVVEWCGRREFRYINVDDHVTAFGPWSLCLLARLLFTRITVPVTARPLLFSLTFSRRLPVLTALTYEPTPPLVHYRADLYLRSDLRTCLASVVARTVGLMCSCSSLNMNEKLK